MDKFSWFIFILGFYLVTAKIKIKELSVPNSVELGTIKNIVLDCDYVPDDKELEIKWFLNGDTNMIYQWIPGQVPQSRGQFKDIIDLTYKASSDGNTMYRALHITNLVPSLSGNYTCKVSGIDSEDSATKPMVVYRPSASGVDLIHNEVQKLIICSANGMYPAPEMDLFVQYENTTTYLKDTDDDDDIYLQDGDMYNVTKEINYGTLELPNPSEIICHLSIPGTTYSVIKSEKFVKGSNLTDCIPIYISTNYSLQLIFAGNATICETFSSDNANLSQTPCIILLLAALVFQVVKQSHLRL